MPVQFDEDRAYVLAAGLIGMQDTPSAEPFTLPEPGLDEGSSVFAFDHAGMRFYLSHLKNPEASVSKSGMLLLSKAETLRHRLLHERLINTLRLHGTILPAESGTVVRGRDDLIRRVDFRLHALLEILLGLAKATTWRVTVSVLDQRVLQVLPAESSSGRASRHEPERGRTVPSGKRIDVKTLERILTREKKLGEAMLQSLVPVAESHEVEYLIGLSGGSSDDWKPILKASLVMAQPRLPELARVIVHTQEKHAMFEPMLVLAGGTESFSLSM